MVEYVKALFSMFNNDEETEGQGLVEYALIIFLIAIAVMGSMSLLAGGIENVFGQITAAL